MTVKFYDYGPRELLKVRVTQAVLEAIEDITDNEGKMGTQEQRYQSGDVVILLHPGSSKYLSSFV